MNRKVLLLIAIFLLCMPLVILPESAAILRDYAPTRVAKGEESDYRYMESQEEEEMNEEEDHWYRIPEEERNIKEDQRIVPGQDLDDEEDAFKNIPLEVESLPEKAPEPKGEKGKEPTELR